MKAAGGEENRRADERDRQRVPMPCRTRAPREAPATRRSRARRTEGPTSETINGCPCRAGRGRRGKRQRRGAVERGEPKGRRARPSTGAHAVPDAGAEGSASDEAQSSEENRRADERDHQRVPMPCRTRAPREAPATRRSRARRTEGPTSETI